MPKLDRAVTVSTAAETADWFAVVTVTCPVAAPGGITNEMLVALAVVIGAAIVPPPCWLSVMVAVPPEPRTRFVPVRVTSVPAGADFGLKSVIDGTPKITDTDCVAVFPATSVAATAIVLVPVLSATVQLKAPFCTVAAAPLQVTTANPESASDTVPEICRLEFVTVTLFAGDVMLNVGAVLSILSVTLAETLSPIASVAVALIT